MRDGVVFCIHHFCIITFRRVVVLVVIIIVLIVVLVLFLVVRVQHPFTNSILFRS